MSPSTSSTSAAHSTADAPYAHFDISTLPQEILLLIFSHVFHDNAGRVSCLSPISLTCRRWRKAIVTENSFWSRLCVEVPSNKARQMAALYASKLDEAVTPEAPQYGLSPSSRLRGLRELQMRITSPPDSDDPKVREIYLAAVGDIFRYLGPLVQRTLRRAIIRVEGASQLLVNILNFFLTQFRLIMGKEAFSALSLEIVLPEVQGFPMGGAFWYSYSHLRALVISALAPYSSQRPNAPTKPAPPKPVVPKNSNAPATIADKLGPLLERGSQAENAPFFTQHILNSLLPSSASSSSRMNSTSVPSPPVLRLLAEVEYNAVEFDEYKRHLSIYRAARHKYDSWTSQQHLNWTGFQSAPETSISDDAHRLLAPNFGGLLDKLVLEGVWLTESLAFPAKGFPSLTSLLLTRVKAGRSLYRLLESAPNLQDLSIQSLIPDEDDTDITVPSRDRLCCNIQLDGSLITYIQGPNKLHDYPVPQRIFRHGNVWITSYQDMSQEVRVKLEMIKERPAYWKWDSELEPELDNDDRSSAFEEDSTDDPINYPNETFMPAKVSAALRGNKVYCVETSDLTKSLETLTDSEHNYRHKVYIEGLGVVPFNSSYHWQELVKMRWDFCGSDAFPYEGELAYYDYDGQDALVSEYTDQCARLAQARQSIMPEPVVLDRLHSLELAGPNTPIVWATSEEYKSMKTQYGRLGEPMIVTPNVRRAVLRNSLDLNGQIPLSSANQVIRRAMPLLDSLWVERLNGSLRLPRDWCAESLAKAMLKGQAIPGVHHDDETWLAELSQEEYDYFVEHPYKINRRRAEWYQDIGWVDAGGDLQREYIQAVLNGLGRNIVPSAFLAITSVASAMTYLDLSCTTLRSSVFTAGIQPLSALNTLILRGVCELENKALGCLPDCCPQLSCLDILAAECLTSVGVAVLVARFREATNGTSGLARVSVEDPEQVEWGSNSRGVLRKRHEITAYQYLDFHGLIPDLWAELWQDAKSEGKHFSKRRMKAVQ